MSAPTPRLRMRQICCSRSSGAGWSRKRRKPYVCSEIAYTSRPPKTRRRRQLACLPNSDPAHTLGDMLDALFAQWSERGPPVSLVSNLPLTGVKLEIERYSRGWDVEFLLRRRPRKTWTNEELWQVEYEFISELLAASDQKQLARAAKRMAEKGGDLVTSACVSERTFSALADCLSQPTHRVIRQPASATG